MKGIGLACSTLSIEGFGETNFDKVFEVAPKIGFKFIEFNCWYPSALTPDTILLLKKRSEAAGLIPAAIHLSSGIGGDLCKDFCHKFTAMQAAKILGAKRVVFSGCKRGAEGGIEAAIASLKALVPVAEDMGMQLCLENHADNVLENISDYRKIFDEISSDCVGLCIDTGHFEAAGVDVDHVIDEFSARVNHIHLKENKEMGKKSFVRFNEGMTDNHHIVDRMIALGYTGYLSIELSPEIGETDGRIFTLEDLALPYKFFSSYEKL